MTKLFSLILTFLATSIGSALAQSYPTRTVNIIIAFPPGGPNEGVVRFLAEKLTSSLGQAVIIENRPGGAGGTVGTRSVANAAPDGHTLLLSPPGPLVVAPLIYKNVGYDPAKAFTPITALSSRKCWSSIRLFS
jgi:tripartite-type tricarboxylate transporter receptor subunit TctC